MAQPFWPNEPDPKEIVTVLAQWPRRHGNGRVRSWPNQPEQQQNAVNLLA
jgi:hypothetical protein